MTSTLESRSTAPRQRTHYQVTFTVIVVATTAYSMLQSLVTPVLPTIQHSLHTSQSTVTWVLTAYLLAASIATPIVGRLGDMMGKKRVLVAVLVMLAVGTLASALATSIGVMIVARVIQGAGGAILPLAFGIIRDEFPREKVAMAVSTTAALLAVGGGLGIVLAGPIVDALNYHFLFWLPLIFIVIAAGAAQLVIPESQNLTPGRISVLPGVLLSAWLVALLVAVSEGSVWGWGSARTVGLLVLSAVLVPVWVVSESRAAQPLVDMRMMRIPAVWTTNLVALLFGAGMYSVMAFLPEFLQTPASAGYGFGASITASGVFLLPMTVTMFVSGLLSGQLADGWGSKRVLVVGSVLTAAAFLVLTAAHDEKWEIYLFSALVGAGLGFAFAAMSNIIVESVPAAQVGVASGMNANIRTIGGSIGAAVMGSIVTSGAAAGGLPVETGYGHGFLFLFVAAVLCAAAAVLVPARRRAALSARADESPDIVVRNAEAALVPAAPVVEVE
ncbi:MAG TPA: MFS transporter [Jatrophihabitans sp.]|nr:MFS transporter [Jatrophihabitans sp.]